MLGKILGLNKNNDQGTILGNDGNRYTFVKEDISIETILEKNMCVDFTPSENKAKEIHICKECFKEKSNLIYGISTIFITLIFGFIGTFISRHLFAKLSLKEVLIPTLLHFSISFVFFIPLVGIIFYIISTLYFTVKNHKIVMKQ